MSLLLLVVQSFFGLVPTAVKALHSPNRSGGGGGCSIGLLVPQLRPLQVQRRPFLNDVMPRRVVSSSSPSLSSSPPPSFSSAGDKWNQDNVWTTGASTTVHVTDEEVQYRRTLLHDQLQLLEIDARAMEEAVMQSIVDPMSGYDGRYGKSAIRTYRSFVHPKQKQPQHQITAMAGRTAQQIDFLLKRHAAHAANYIRHHDTITANAGAVTTTSSGTTTNHTTSSLSSSFPSIILILDNVRSALNVGSLFRTADATGCTAVWTVGITPHPMGNGAHKLCKSALGAERLVPSQHFTTLQQALHYLRTGGKQQQQQDIGRQDERLAPYGNIGGGGSTLSESHYIMERSIAYHVVGLETTEHSVDYTSVPYLLIRNTTQPTQPTTARTTTAESTHVTSQPDRQVGTTRRGVALVLGNEVTGVTASLLSEMDVLVQIPTYGVKNSLNVAVCAPIVLYEILRQWKEHEEEEGEEEKVLQEEQHQQQQQEALYRETMT